MKRWSYWSLLAVPIVILAGCATGTAQDPDVGWHDTWTETPGDLWDMDSPWDTGDPSPDPLGDTLTDSAVDSSLDTMTDTALDTMVDTVDVTDTVADDPGTEELPTTCTISDLVTQAMCGAGRKCTFTTVDTLGNPEPFCDVAGAQGWNDLCGSGGASDNCQAGYMCLASGGGDSRCRRFCSSDTTCTTYPGGANASCEIGISVGGTEVIGVTTCSFHCDVLTQTGCDTGQGCRASFPGDYTYWTDCTTAADGSACVAGTGADCVAGWDCFSIDSDGDTVSDYNECLEYCSYPYGSCTTGTCSQGTAWPSTIGVCF